MTALLMLLPPQFAVLLIAGSGLAMILGARALAGTLFTAALALVFLPILLAPLFDALPTWLLLGLLVFFVFGLLRVVFNLLIGKRSTEHMVGILAADVVRFAFLAPFRLLGWIVRAFRGPM
jgi:hypothetical protein